jgi:hypothetical protein
LCEHGVLPGDLMFEAGVELELFQVVIGALAIFGAI